MLVYCFCMLLAVPWPECHTNVSFLQASKGSNEEASKTKNVFQQTGFKVGRILLIYRKNSAKKDRLAPMWQYFGTITCSVLVLVYSLRRAHLEHRLQHSTEVLDNQCYPYI